MSAFEDDGVGFTASISRHSHAWPSSVLKGGMSTRDREDVAVVGEELDVSAVGSMTPARCALFRVFGGHSPSKYMTRGGAHAFQFRKLRRRRWRSRVERDERLADAGLADDEPAADVDSTASKRKSRGGSSRLSQAATVSWCVWAPGRAARHRRDVAHVWLGSRPE